MSTEREKVLAEHLRNRLIGIQGSQDVYQELSEWERAALLLDKREKQGAATWVAKRTEKFAERVLRKTGHLPTPDEVMRKIKELLKRIEQWKSQETNT